MNKRISDEEIENRLKYFMPINNDVIENMLLDLKDAREALKKYEPRKPSLTEYLKKLANKHKVTIGCYKNAIEFFIGNYTANAEKFFIFCRSDFTDDVKVTFFNPEVTDE